MNRFGERDRLSAGTGVGDLPARGLADIPAGIDDQNAVSQIDLLQVKVIQDRLLFSGDWRIRLGWCEDDYAREGQVAVRRAQLLSESDGAADATISGRSGTAQSFSSRERSRTTSSHVACERKAYAGRGTEGSWWVSAAWRY